MQKRVVVFSGAHAPKKEYSEFAYKLGGELARGGYTTVTGGGPGLMLEVTRGAFENNGITWGICISRRKEEVSKEYFSKFEMYDLFDDRNDRLIELGEAFVVLPGGLGTIVEALQITQRKKFGELPAGTPLIFVGPFYDRLVSLITDIKIQGFIGEKLEGLFSRADTPEAIVKQLDEFFARTRS